VNLYIIIIVTQWDGFHKAFAVLFPTWWVNWHTILWTL